MLIDIRCALARLLFIDSRIRRILSNGVNHITSRGNEKKAVFKDDQDRLNVLNILQHVNKRYTCICHAYCLMDTLIIS